MLRFPDSNIITERLSNYPLLKTDDNLKKGITKAIAELAAERFANREKLEMGITWGTKLIINDLRLGKDELTGKHLPNLGKLGLDDIAWTLISMATEAALLDCAIKV